MHWYFRMENLMVIISTFELKFAKKRYEMCSMNWCEHVLKYFEAFDGKNVMWSNVDIPDHKIVSLIR